MDFLEFLEDESQGQPAETTVARAEIPGEVVEARGGDLDGGGDGRRKPEGRSSLDKSAATQLRTIKSLRSHLAKYRKSKVKNNQAMVEFAKQVKPRSTRVRIKIVKKRQGKQEVVLRASATKVRGEKQCGADLYVEAAFKSPPNTEHAGLQLGVHRRTVTRMRCVVAEFLLDLQLKMLASLVALATASPPLFCISREAWDETGQVCIFRIDSSSSASQARSRWEVMVYRCSICIGWGDGSGKSPLVYEFVLPPVIIPSTSAANMYYSLRNHPSFMRFQGALHMLRQKCKLQGFLMETDAAYGNEKLINFFQQRVYQGPQYMFAWKSCHSHRNMHVETMVLGAVGMDLLGDLYCTCAFLKSGGHFQRLRGALDSWAQEVVDSYVMPGAPPPLARRLGATIAAYFRDNGKAFGKSSSARGHRWEHKIADPIVRDRRAEERHQRHASGLAEFLQNTYNGLGPGAIVHHCCGPACCPQGAASLKGRLVEGMRSFVLNRIPSPPVASKWTKLVPALNAILIGVLLRCWAPVWKLAFSALTMATGPQAEADGEEDPEDGGQEVNYQALAGRRYKKAMTMLQDKEKSIALIILAICLEPVRLLTEFFIRCSSDVRDNEAHPPLMTLLLPDASPLTRVMQYLAYLYFEHGQQESRVFLLSLWLGYPDMCKFATGALNVLMFSRARWRTSFSFVNLATFPSDKCIAIPTFQTLARSGHTHKCKHNALVCVCPGLAKVWKVGMAPTLLRLRQSEHASVPFAADSRNQRQRLTCASINSDTHRRRYRCVAAVEKCLAVYDVLHLEEAHVGVASIPLAPGQLGRLQDHRRTEGSHSRVLGECLRVLSSGGHGSAVEG